MYLYGLKNGKANIHGEPTPKIKKWKITGALECACVPLCNLFFLFPLRTLLSGIHPVLLFICFVFLAQLHLMEIPLSKGRALKGRKEKKRKKRRKKGRALIDSFFNFLI